MDDWKPHWTVDDLKDARIFPTKPSAVLQFSAREGRKTSGPAMPLRIEINPAKMDHLTQAMILLTDTLVRQMAEAGLGHALSGDDRIPPTELAAFRASAGEDGSAQIEMRDVDGKALSVAMTAEQLQSLREMLAEVDQTLSAQKTQKN